MLHRTMCSTSTGEKAYPEFRQKVGNVHKESAGGFNIINQPLQTRSPPKTSVDQGLPTSGP